MSSNNQGTGQIVNPNAGGYGSNGRYNSKQPNGRKGQQALQSSYFNRPGANNNYPVMAASHEGSLRGANANGQQ